VAVERSVQRQLQRIVGDLGRVQPWRPRTDRAHRSVGWYVTPSRAQPGCGCSYCRAALEGADLYLGYNRTDAIFEAELAVRAHDTAAVA
jgi:hypothetical protein